MAFAESQKLNIGLRLLVVVATIPAVIIIARDWIRNPTDEVWYALLSVIGITAGLYFILLNPNAHTRIDTQGVHYKYFPFIRNWKIISWSDITKIMVKPISPLSDFGGWGYRWGRKRKGIILSGDNAIYMELKNGRQFVITTKLPEQARREIAAQFEERIE